MLFLTTIKEKYVKMYERFILELKSYSKAITIPSKGYLPISLMPPSKLEAILEQVRLALAKTNKDYELVLTRLYLYYDMKLATFGIDNQRNLITGGSCLSHTVVKPDSCLAWGGSKICFSFSCII